jgi:hypothetical protein
MLYTPGQSSLAAELEQITLAFKLNGAYSKQQILRLTHVIDRMVAVGYLTRAQGAQALSAHLGIVPRDQAGC